MLGRTSHTRFALISSLPSYRRGALGITLAHYIAVSSHPLRLSRQQSRQTSDIHSHRERCLDRGQPNRPDSPNIQAFRGAYGATAPSTINPIDQFTGEASQGHQEPDNGSSPAELPKSYVEFRLTSRTRARLHCRYWTPRERVCICRSHG
jgi:hypothetical protein